MIDLRGCFPERPAEFDDKAPKDKMAKRKWDKIQRARRKIGAKIKASEQLESKDFDDLWKDYRSAFRDAQHGGKCAYCETRIAAAQSGDVEHFRPKACVQEPTGRGNRDDAVGRPGRKMEPREYPGYWWLAYEWSNYLYACSLCNSTWKGNSFPLRQLRKAMVQGCEAHEEPMLLQPFLEDPEPHFEFDELGQIHALTDRGQATIDTCGLDRELLRYERERLVRRMLQDFDDLAIGLLRQSSFDRRMMALCHHSSEYAGLAKRLIEKHLQSLLATAPS